MNREQRIDELMGEIQDVFFRAKYGNVSIDEQISLNQRGNKLIDELRLLENK